LQNCATVTTIIGRSCHLREKPPAATPPSSPQHPQPTFCACGHACSGRSVQWNHATCGLLCLASPAEDPIVKSSTLQQRQSFSSTRAHGVPYHVVSSLVRGGTCGSLSPLLICMVPRPHASILSELCVCPAHTGTQVPRQWCPTGQASVTGPLLLHSWPVSQRTSPWPPPVSR
jgi:hypothetical protein